MELSPTVSAVNYAASQTIANAAIVPAGTNVRVTPAVGCTFAERLVS